MEIGRVEGAVGLADTYEVGVDLVKAAADGGPVALAGFDDFAGRGAADFLARPWLGVVVDDKDLVDDL